MKPIPKKLFRKDSDSADKVATDIRNQPSYFKKFILPWIKKLIRSHGGKRSLTDFRKMILIQEELEWLFPLISDVHLQKSRNYIDHIKDKIRK
jgi:hypothetical protein